MLLHRFNKFFLRSKAVHAVFYKFLTIFGCGLNYSSKYHAFSGTIFALLQGFIPFFVFLKIILQPIGIFSFLSAHLPDQSYREYFRFGRLFYTLPQPSQSHSNFSKVFPNDCMSCNQFHLVILLLAKPPQLFSSALDLYMLPLNPDKQYGNFYPALQHLDIITWLIRNAINFSSRLLNLSMLRHYEGLVKCSFWSWLSLHNTSRLLYRRIPNYNMPFRILDITRLS